MAEEERVELRRSARLALAEINSNETINETTPNKNVSADEMVIIQRGPRRKPLIWSPVDQDRTPRKTPELESIQLTETLPKRPCMNPKLRRRLILTPTKNSGDLGNAIAKKLLAFPKFNEEFTRNEAQT